MCYIVVNILLGQRSNLLMKHIEKARSLVREASSGRMNQQDTFLLRVPKAGHLARCCLCWRLYSLWVSSLLMCNFFRSNRLVCWVPARQAECSLTCIQSRLWVPFPTCFLVLKMSWQPEKQACQCGDLGEVYWTVSGLSLKLTFEKKPPLTTW